MLTKIIAGGKVKSENTPFDRIICISRKRIQKQMYHINEYVQHLRTLLNPTKNEILC